ncbi:pyridoxal phosphate-dependent aminotransferase [Bradyrhizobium sp. DOA9]|uniref:pyridoxal phosphate-dependent aminotransferase n=1 Tax=Bradyrhizobium sp. DOA9 TaxID=1126627 RepID=UPI00046871AE|nr:aminotransferase class I/II-fold pyridoxal phosphate-dependent enzyme [Bradyrhizobium sp. DOA9]
MSAKRMSLLPSSGTATARETATRAVATGARIIDLSAGEVSIEPPSSVREGALGAVNAGVNRYTDSIGMLPLRAAVAEDLSRNTGLTWHPDEVAITAGAKQALLNASLALLDPGDEVIIIRPYWPTFAAQVRLIDATPVFVDTFPPDYLPNVETIGAAITPKTKAIIINSPNNPTGAVYDSSTLCSIGAAAVEYGLWIISDECYSNFIFTGAQHQSILTAHPGVRPRTILVNAFSKALAITGWRVGYLAAPPEIISATKLLQSHTTSNPNVIAQHAILHHIQTADGEFAYRMHERLSKVRRLGLSILSELTGATAARADGTFFFYLDLERLLKRSARTEHSIDRAAQLLLTEGGVCSVAGSAFGDMSGLRLSFGAPPDLVEAGLRRTVQTLNGLSAELD